MPEFSSRDPLDPAFWDERFAHDFTPWDRKGVPQALNDFVARGGPACTVLIPGCGNGYELACMLEAGWDATAIDFSPVAVRRARAQVGNWSARVVLADFFAWQPPRQLDLIYERAFLCAMPPALWPKVAARWAQLLAPGGELAGYFFFGTSPKGPPFGIPRTALDELLASAFVLEEEGEVVDSLPVFGGQERWMRWRRR